MEEAVDVVEDVVFGYGSVVVVRFVGLECFVEDVVVADVITFTGDVI